MTDSQTIQRAHRDYLESRILSAHPVEVVHMLYQVAIDNLNAAIAHLKNGDRTARSYAVTRAQEAVNELALALDHSVSPSYSRTLASLYGYVLQQIVDGNARQTEKPFQEALSILNTLASAWAEVKARICHPNASGEIEHAPPSEPNEYVEADRETEVRSASTAYSQALPDSAPSRDWSC
jgi:flagellar protein FliS